jgi:hypothetical protein
MGTTISAPAGFFINDSVTPATATDLLSAVTSAQDNVNNALTSEQNAASSATAAASSATAAAASANTASQSISTCQTAATNAASSASAASTSASNASTYANNASTYANNASSSASGASTSATNAASSATAAANSATNANTYAGNASTSATNAANSATAASNSATAAASSASTASTQASTATTQANDASTSATNAASSASSASTSATNAANSATAAANSAAVATALDAGNIGRNFVHNAKFNIQQRGTGSWATTAAYTADRWLLSINGSDAITASIYTMTDTDRSAIGDESAVSGLQIGITGSSVTGSASYLLQRIESCRRLSGKIVSLSFWAKASSGSPTITAGVQQSFGTGGSTAVTTNFASQQLTASWQHFYFNDYAIPSAAGKTFGTAGTDYTQLELTLTTAASPQSGTIQIWGVQLEVNSSYTALEAIDPGLDLLRCQRFYQTGTMQLVGYEAGTGVGLACIIPLPVTMRATPTVTPTWTNQTNGTGVLNASGPGALQLEGSATSAGVTANVAGTFTASADL